MPVKRRIEKKVVVTMMALVKVVMSLDDSPMPNYFCQPDVNHFWNRPQTYFHRLIKLMATDSDEYEALGKTLLLIDDHRRPPLDPGC